MHLPCELIGLNGTHVTKEAREREVKSSVLWKIDFDEVPKPSKASFKMWEECVEWLTHQEIITIVDFESSMTTRFEISEDAKCIKENAENSRMCYEKDEMQHGQQTCRQIERDVIQEWKKIIAEMKPNK